jgi:hypothetical protein
MTNAPGNLNSFLNGSLTAATIILVMFFWRFRRQTGDQLFSNFAWAFFVLGIERIVLESTAIDAEGRAYIYLMRLFAFVLIIAGIVNKNRRQRAENGHQSSEDEQNVRHIRAVR